MTAWLAGLSEAVPGRRAFLVGRQRLSFGELREQVARTRGLFLRLGLGPGDRIAIATADDLAVSVLYAACLTSGATAVVLDPQASAAETLVLIGKARPRAIFADSAVLERSGPLTRAAEAAVVAVASAAAKRSSFGLLLRRSEAAPAESFPALLQQEQLAPAAPPAAADACALVLFTSGTTSQPKGVQMSFRGLTAQMATFRRQYGYDASSVVANPLPLHHSDGLNQGPLLAFATGATLVRPPAVTMQSLGALLDSAYRERATHLVTVPTVLAMMLRLPRDYDDALGYEAFRFISSTAGPLSETIWRQVEERFAVPVVNSYGLTETCIEALYCGPDGATRRLGTVGKPVDCLARIVTEDGREAETGERGELWLSGENVMLGYLDQPEATAEVLQDGWLRTGDLATRDAEGFYRIVGRKKSVIIRGGINVYPEDVNAALLACPGVAQAATVGLPDDLLGERVVACVILRNGGGAGLAERAMEHCRQALAPEKLPNRIEVLEALPFGPSGKVELEKLRQQLAARMDGGATAGTPLAGRVLAVAAAVFQARLEDLSPESGDDDVAGWDSLNYLEFVMTLERQFNFKMAPRDVMNIRRLADAIAVVERAAGAR